MSVYQVEEFYVHMQDLKMTQKQKGLIKDYLTQEDCPGYEFQDNDTMLVIDGVESEYHGEILEDHIKSLLNI